MSHAAPLEAGQEPYPGWRLLQRIGSGGFAEVWQARDPECRLVAIKFISASHGAAAFAEVRTIQLIQGLQHPNLVRIHAVWTYHSYLAVAMEQADGTLTDLRDVYESEFGTSIPAEQLMPLMEQAADAIDFLNARQHRVGGKLTAFQHCDVKPRNLLLFGDNVKLSDFGLASEISCQLKWHRRAGTLAYMAPEVFQGRLSQWTDQYALAVTYCELRGGRLPFRDTPHTCRRDYVRPAPDLSMLPPDERAVVARGLAPIPQDRWPSCRNLVDNLLPVLV